MRCFGSYFFRQMSDCQDAGDREIAPNRAPKEALLWGWVQRVASKMKSKVTCRVFLWRVRICAKISSKLERAGWKDLMYILGSAKPIFGLWEDWLQKFRTTGRFGGNPLPEACPFTSFWGLLDSKSYGLNISSENLKGYFFCHLCFSTSFMTCPDQVRGNHCSLARSIEPRTARITASNIRVLNSSQVCQ